MPYDYGIEKAAEKLGGLIMPEWCNGEGSTCFMTHR